MTHDERIAEIEARLKAAVLDDGWMLAGNDLLVLQANAPADLRFLLEQLAEARKDSQRLALIVRIMADVPWTEVPSAIWIHKPDGEKYVTADSYLGAVDAALQNSAALAPLSETPT